MARTIRVEAVGGGSRGAGGITGAGGKNVNPIYKESIPPASVKSIPAGSKPATPKSIESIRNTEAKRLADSQRRVDRLKNAQNGNLESIKNGTLDWGKYR